MTARHLKRVAAAATYVYFIKRYHNKLLTNATTTTTNTCRSNVILMPIKLITRLTGKSSATALTAVKAAAVLNGYLFLFVVPFEICSLDFKSYTPYKAEFAVFSVLKYSMTSKLTPLTKCA